MKKRFKKLIILLAVVLSLLSFSVQTYAEKGEAITILFTHDIHDHFYPSDIERDGRIEEIGGFVRMKTVIDKERNEDPDLLLLDAGDYSMGTLFQTIFESHSPTLRMMGRLGFDATTFGNHEFDFRAEGLANSLNAALESGDPLPEIVDSNTVFPYDETEGLTSSLEALSLAMNSYGVEDYIVLEKKGLRIGPIGLMGEDADSNAPMSEVEFKDIVTSSRELVKILKDREEVDLIIALSHTGTD